jgi:hypothetical protein
MNNARYPAGLIHISVTWADINDGRAWCGERCPVALAIHRAVPESDYVFVGTYDAVIGIPSAGGSRYSRRTYQLTREITDFMARFDSGHDVAPFEADLRAVA